MKFIPIELDNNTSIWFSNVHNHLLQFHKENNSNNVFRE